MARRNKNEVSAPHYCGKSEYHFPHFNCDGIFSKVCVNLSANHDAHLWSEPGAGGYLYIKACPGVVVNEWAGPSGWIEPVYCGQWTEHKEHRFLQNNKMPNDYAYCVGVNRQFCAGPDVHPEHEHQYQGASGFIYKSYCPGSLADRWCLNRVPHGAHVFDKGAYLCKGLEVQLPERCSDRLVNHSSHFFKYEVFDGNRASVTQFSLECDGILSQVKSIHRKRTGQCFNELAHNVHEFTDALHEKWLCPGVVTTAPQVEDDGFINYKCGLKQVHGPHVAEENWMGTKIRCFGNLFEGLMSPNTARKAAGLTEASVEDVIAGVIRREVDRQIRERIRLENLEAIRRFGSPWMFD